MLVHPTHGAQLGLPRAQAPVLLSRREVFAGRDIARETHVLLVRPLLAR